MTTCKLSETISPAFVGSHRAIKAGAVNELVEKGGRGSCKSSFISLEIILLILKNPLIHACVFRKYGNTLRTTVYTQIVWAIAQLGLARKFRCTVSPMECVYIPTGQKIMFFGMDDPGKVKSIKVPFGYIGIDWFEELDQFDGPEQIRNVEQSTLRGGPFSFTFKSFNPPAMARNWANRYVLEKKPGQLVHHSTYLTTPPEWLGPRFIADAEHLKNTNPTGYRHEYLGEVVGSGTQVFENLKIRAITDAETKEFDRITNGVDWGWYDLKTLGEKAGPNTMFQRVKKAKRQSRNFIIDVSDTKLDREMIDQQISKIFWSENTRFVDEIVIINDGHIVRVAKRA